MTKNEKEYRKRYTKTHWMLYAHTFNGYTGRMYCSMQHRIRTRYAGRNFGGLFTLKEFRQFLLKNDFQSIYDRYLKSGRERRLAPSIDRIDNKKGYFFENMQLMTQVENARKGSWPERKVNLLLNSKLTVEDVRNIRKEYPKMKVRELAEKYKVKSKSIYKVLRRETWSNVN